MDLYLESALLIIIVATILWVYSVVIRNASIVDIFWGAGFVLISLYLFYFAQSISLRKAILLTLVSIWGLRLTIYIFLRNKGKPEDFRYQKFREDYGKHRYWWISYFQVFLLQGLLMILIASPLAGVFLSNDNIPLNIFDYLAMGVWLIGFCFEAGGDYQLAKFKKNKNNKGEVLSSGFWKYTRHPNYFGDSAVWWSYALFAIAAHQYWFIAGSFLMTFLIVKISGVAMLEKSLTVDKPQYREYIERTSTFFPWFPKKTSI